jgi:hypothetical protein
MDVSLWGPGIQCYGLNVKCPQSVYVLYAWAPAGSAIWGDCGKCRWWGLAEGSRSLRAVFGGHFVPIPFHSPSHPILPVYHVSSFATAPLLQDGLNCLKL